MRIVKLNDNQLMWLRHALEAAEKKGDDFYMAYDHLDKGVKFKVGDYTWSPPMVTEEK